MFNKRLHIYILYCSSRGTQARGNCVWNSCCPTPSKHLHVTRGAAGVAKLRPPQGKRAERLRCKHNLILALVRSTVATHSLALWYCQHYQVLSALGNAKQESLQCRTAHFSYQNTTLEKIKQAARVEDNGCQHAITILSAARLRSDWLWRRVTQEGKRGRSQWTCVIGNCELLNKF